MKKSVCLILLFFISLHFTWAQECLNYKLKTGNGFEMSTYDGNGKSAGKLNYKIVDVASQGAESVITIEMETFDTKGKSQMKNTYKMICDGNTLRIDASAMINQEQRKSFEKMEMKFTFNDIEYPKNLSVGQELKESQMKGEGSGPIPMFFTMRIYNRKVVDKENIKVPAGNFDVYKITSDNEMNSKMGINIKYDTQTVSYRSPDVIWDIKSETYRKGKLISSSELTKIY
jgi:hypothetical protein